MKIWISLALVAIAFGAAKAQDDDDYALPDYWQSDYEWYSDEAEKLGIVSSAEKNEPENDNNDGGINEIAPDDPEKKDDPEGTDVVVGDAIETKLNEEDKSILQEIDEFRKTLENENDRDSFDLFDDYQFEDNRSDPDKEQLDVADEVVEQPKPAEAIQDELAPSYKEDSTNLEDTAVDKINDNNNENVIDEPAIEDTNNQEILDETRNILAEDDADESAILPPSDDVNQKIFAETHDILNNDEEEMRSSKEIIDENQDIPKSDKNEEAIEEPPLDDNNNQEIFDETRAILDEDEENNKLTDELHNSDAQDYVGIPDVLPDSELKEQEELNAESDSQDSDSDENDEIPKELEDLLESLNVRVNEELTKMSDPVNEDGESDSNEVEQKVDENNNDRGPVEEEMKNSKETGVVPNDDIPQDDIDDDTVDKAMGDLTDDLKQLLDTWDKLTNNDVEDDDTAMEDVLKFEEKYGKPYREDIVLSQRDDDYENVEDNDLDQIFAKLFEESKSDRVAVEHTVPDNHFDFPNIEGIHIYDNDGIDADDNSKEANEKSIDDISAPVNEETLEDVNPELVGTAEKEPIKQIRVEDLTPSQYEDVMKQFAEVHSEHLDTNSDDFGRNVAPIHMRLSVDEPRIVESPNHPGNYPTNNIVDWIFDGEGVGIELNITDFAVNGALGDYLLIKPGGVDDTRNDGLIFSYTLNEQRNFRFLDVDRMFVRFESRPAMIGMRGFQFSVRMVAPIPEDPEPEPEPAPLLPVPRETMTVYLGGLTLRDFLEVKNEFRQIIADMATLYINTNSIAMGLNTTEEITQITRAELCNVDWPDFEVCSAVTFGVPLVYEDEETPARLNGTDLQDMWNLYNSQDPFDLRLRRLGIKEFWVPNDGSVLMVWLVIAGGVLVSMGLLAFALWRCSCFEGYTRMAAYSDTDSMNEKRTLDLYPTPHQTLPPLYSDQDYKWDDDIKFDDSTRVDMGGFANKSYVRDDLFDMDSDEDIVASPRDRNSVSPRDNYNV